MAVAQAGQLRHCHELVRADVASDATVSLCMGEQCDRDRALPYLRRWARRLAGRRFWIGLNIQRTNVDQPLTVGEQATFELVPATT